MNAIAMIAAGVDTLVRRVLSGDMPKEDWWCAMKGASRFLASIASGDVAPEPAATERAEVCVKCPSVTKERIVVMGLAVDKLYCGLASHATIDPPTCGCLVGCTIDGKVYPGAKTRVGTARCPQGKW